MDYQYRGQLNLTCDGPRNLGALSQLIDLVANSIDYSKCQNDREKSLLKANTDLALSKISQGFTPRMEFANFEIKYLVGFGSYGRIWKSSSKSTGDVAIKQMPATLESCAGIWKERDIMIYLKHPRICNLVGAFYYSDAFLVMELCYGSVAALRKKITPENAVRFSMHLLQAVKWIHSKNVVHADLKPDNCLIKTDNTLVISDFGSAFILESDQNHVVLDESHGSHGYQDYQALKFFRFSKETDIFATACIIFEMDVKATLLFYHSRQSHPRSIYIDAIENGRVIGLIPSLEPTPKMEREQIADRALHSQFGWLLQKMITDTDRITAEQAIEDSSFRSVITEARVSLSTPSKRKDYVTREFNYDTSKKFALYNRNNMSYMDISFLTFYYDQYDETLTFCPGVKQKKRHIMYSQNNDNSDSGDDIEETSCPDYERLSATLSPLKKIRRQESMETPLYPSKTPRRTHIMIVPTPGNNGGSPTFEQNSRATFLDSDDSEDGRVSPDPVVISNRYVVNHPDLSPLPSLPNTLIDHTNSSSKASSCNSIVNEPCLDLFAIPYADSKSMEYMQD